MDQDTRRTSDADDDQHSSPGTAEETGYVPTTRRTFLGTIAAASTMGSGGAAAAARGGGAGALVQETASSHGYGQGGYGAGQYGGSDTDPGNTVDLTLQPAETEIPPETTRTYDLVIEGTANGVGSYNAEITVEDTDVAEIVDARPFNASAGLFETVIAEDGSSVSFAGLVQFDAASEITIAEIDVESADTEGETSLGLTVAEVNDGDGDPYTVGSATGATLTVSKETGPPALPGQDSAPQDLNGDGLYRDVNGDGQFSVGDVQVLFQNRDSDAVQNNPEAFNFDETDPPTVSVGDVQALFLDFTNDANSDASIDSLDADLGDLGDLGDPEAVAELDVRSLFGGE